MSESENDGRDEPSACNGVRHRHTNHEHARTAIWSAGQLGGQQAATDRPERGHAVYPSTPGEGHGTAEYVVEKTAIEALPMCHIPWYSLAQETFG